MAFEVKTILKRIFNLRVFLKAGALFIGLLLFVLFMDLVLMPIYTKHGLEYELPDVTDRPVEVAIELLKNEGFKPILQDSVYDENFSTGSIIQQNPLPFSRVKKGRRVYLVVSIGEKPRFMPQLVGLTPQDAGFRIREEGLRLDYTSYDFSSTYPRGVVIKQSIPAGDPVKVNKPITITVSLGPEPTSLEIPDLIGKSLKSAEKELEVLGVHVKTVKMVYRDNLVPGTVLMQSIPAGKKAAKIDSISLVVSTDQQPLEEVEGDSTKN